MRIRFICVGKLKERFYRDASAEFLKRLSRYADAEVVELTDEKIRDNPSAADIEAVKIAECKRIFEKLSDSDYVIALDPRGKQFSSEELSATISDCMLHGKSRISFIIGGSYGLTDAIRKCADVVLSFSKMTFSHQIFRIMLMEQAYRAFKIITGEPYHK